MTNEEINLAIAAIHGYTQIDVWNQFALKVTYQGTNEAHPELGKFVPKYVESLDAIANVFRALQLDYKLQWSSGVNYAIAEYVNDDYESIYQSGSTEALALCKLLLVINPDPIKPKVKADVFDVEFG
jgi:hypothetical protein